MSKKKNKLFLIIPGFLLIGMAIGVQTQELFKHTITGLIVGIIVFFFLKYRNKKIDKTRL